MLSSEGLAIPLGSLVVVTGVSGFIASHAVDQLLEAGYQVRGTARGIEKARWVQEFFDKKFGIKRFELTEVPEMEADGAFDDAVKGAAGLAHVAAPVVQSFGPSGAVPMVVNGTLNALKAAAKELLVTRVVLTSSSTAAASPQPNKKFLIDDKTWNVEAVKDARAPPPYKGVPETA